MAEIDDENIVNEDNQYSRVDDTTTDPPFNFLQPGFSFDQYLSDKIPNPETTYPAVDVTPDMGLSPYMKTYLDNVQSGAKKAMSNADFGYLGGYFDKKYESALRAVDQNIKALNISEEDRANIYKDQNAIDQYVQVYNNWRDSGGTGEFVLFDKKYDPAVGDPNVIENYTDPKLKQKFDERLKKKYTAKNYLTYNKAFVYNLPDELNVNTLNNYFKGTDIYFDMDNGELRANYGDQSTKELQAAPGGFFQGAVELFTGKESLGMNSLVVDPYNPIQLSKWIQNTLLTAEEEKKISVSNPEEKKDNYYKLQLSRPEKFQSSQINTKAINNYVVKQKEQVVYLAKRLESDKNELDKVKGTETIIKYDNLVKEFTTLNDKLTGIKKNLEGKKNPSEKDINDYNLQVENLNKIYQSIEELKKTDEFSYYSELNNSFVKNSESLVKLNENAKTIEEQNKVAIARQYIDKEATGSFVGNIASGLYTGMMEKAETAVVLALDAAVGTGLIKVDDLFGPSYTMDLDKSDTQKYNEFKRELSNVFDNEITNRFTEKVFGTTEEYAQSDKRNDLEKSARMVSEALGIVTGAGGNPYLTYFGFFSQSYNAINKEMRGKEFDDLTSFEKNILAVPVSMAVGYLDKLGAKVSLGDPLVEKLLLKTLAKAVTEIPKDATIEYVESVVKKSIANQISLGTLKIVGSSLVEGFTEGGQEITTMGAKALFNEYHQKDLFNLPDITTEKGREEAKKIVLENIYYGAIGGVMMSSGEQAVSALKNGFDNSKADAKFDLLYNTITDPELILTAKNAIKLDLANKKITRETAEQRMESVNSVYSLFKSIPKELSTEQKKEAFNLIREKQTIEKEIEGKDPSLVDAQKKRVSEINESLKTISNNAAKETTNKQQAGTAEGGVSEYQGTSEGQPEVGQVEGGQREATVNETDSRNSTITSKVQEEVANKTTDENYDISQEVNNNIAKANPDASVLLTPKGNDLSLTAVYVGKEKRGKGIGTKVLETVKSEANRTGKKIVLDATNELDSETDLERLSTFYEKNGFKKVGENKFEYSPQENAVATYRAEEQAELLKVIPKIENYKVNGEIDKTLMPKTVLDKYNKVYNKYDKLISPLLETAAPKSVVQEEVVPGTTAKVADIDIVYPTQKQAEERKALRSTTEYVENASKELPVENIDVLSKELGGEFGLLTAENPMAQPLTEEENKQLNQKAKEWLTSKGYNPRRITGKYNQAENSFFVPNLTKQDAIEFAKQFNQESVAHSDGLVYQDGSMNPRVKEDDNLSFADSYSPDSDFVSVANTKDGLKTFSIGYNFDKKIRPKKQDTKKTDYKQNLVTIENAREVASKQDTPLKQKIAKSAAMIMKSLPGVKVYLHNNQSEMHQAIADSTGRDVDDISNEVGNSAGAQIKKEIHVNMDTAKETTILHEAFHEAILRSGKSFQTITDFANGLKNIISDKEVKTKLEEFISMYKESDRAEEFLSELGAIMSEAETELTTTKFQKFLNLINRIARSLGLPVIIKSSATAQEAVDFINYMSKSLRTGEAISVSNAINVDTNELSIKQEKIGDFDVSYFEDANEFKKLVKEGLVENNYDINKISGEVVAVHQPDNMFVGTLKNLDKEIFNGNGGVFYTSITGNVWASGAESSAKSLAKLINKSLEESTDGVGRLVLVRGTDSKMISSTEGVKASMSIIELLVDKGLINRSEFRSSLIRAGKKFNIDFSGKDSSAAIHKDIKEKFMDVKNSTFQKRGDFFDEVINDLSKTSKSATENIDGIRKALGSKRKISFSKDGIRDSIGDILTERLLKDLPTSHAYAIIEVTEPVTYRENKGHDSYPWILESKSKPKLKLLYNRGHAVKDGVFEMIDGSAVSQGKLGLAQRGMGIAKISEQPSKIKQQKTAPNGKPSKLDDVQWEQVRTPAFKKWFGDWENDPQNASKVVDENGEPLVVYHGSKVENIEIFNTKVGTKTKSKMQLLFGTHFAQSIVDAKIYAKEKGKIYETFLSIKNPINLSFGYVNRDDKNFQNYYSLVNDLKLDKKNKNVFDYDLFTDKGEYGGKSKYIQRIFITQNQLDQLSPNNVRDSLIKNNFDGVIYTPYQPIGLNQISNFSESFIAFEPNQIKLADGTNTTFDATQPSIKLQKQSKDDAIQDAKDIHEKSFKRFKDEKRAIANAINNLEKSDWYKNADDTQREQAVVEVKQSLGVKIKRAPSVAKIMGTPKPKMVTVNEAAAFKDQLRLEAKAAREAKADLNQKRKSLSDAIKGMVKLGKLKVSQASTIIKRVSQVNLDNPVMVERLIDYAAKVFERADYQEKLDRAFSYKRAIKKLLKTNNQAQVVGMANEFTKLDPSMVENIEEYIDIAEKVKKAVAPSRAKTFTIDNDNYFDMVLKQATNIEAVSKFVKNELEKQDQQLKDELLATNDDLLESGFISRDMTAKQIQGVIDSMKKDPAYKMDSKEKEGYMMTYLSQRFNSLAEVISDIIKTNQNPVTGERVAIDQKDVAIMSDLLKVDLSEMGIRDALFIVEAMDNFITNGITSKLEGALSTYKGEMGIKEEIKSGKVARPLRLYFTKKAGRELAIEFTPLPLMIERMFNGVKSGISIMKSMGLSIVINGVNKANYLHNKIIDEYYNKFIRKSKTFHTPENVYERGMLAFLKRNVTGSLEEMKAETNRRVKMITQSITTLKNKGDKSQKAMAEIYQKVFDKLDVSTGDIDVIESRASKENKDAVNWWINQWSKHYKDLSDVSLSVYNYDLGSDLNYTPDKYKLIKTEEFDQKLIERNSSFLISMDNYTDKEKTGVLMQSIRPNAMEEGRYVSLDFDANNSNSLKGALVDINTAAGIRQVDGFLNSKLLDKLIPSTEDRDALVIRVNRYIRRSKGKIFIPKDLSKDVDSVINFAASLGVGKALGGALQSVKQTIPIAISTAIMTGKFNIPSVSFNEWLNKTGMPTANRGLESLSTIESMDRRLEAKGTIIKDSVKTFQKISEIYLKLFLSKPDVMIARMAFQSYYLQYMKESSIDWANHTPNQDALNYAEAMVGRQQNINDPMLGGEFLTAEDSMKRISKKVLLPFASFGLNQKARLNSDLINMASKTTSVEDRKIAFKSASATLAEMVAYRAIAVGIGYGFYKSAEAIIKNYVGDDEDDDDDKERDKKWFLSSVKFPLKSMINDLISPLPLTDEYVTMGADYILSQYTGYTEAELDELVKNENEIRALKDLDPLEGRQLKKFREEEKQKSLYQLAGKYESSAFGMGSIFYDAAKKFYNEYQLAMTGEFKDEYRGNVTTKKIRPVEQEVIKNSLIFSSLFMLGILPKEADQVTTKVVNMIKRNAMSESEYEKYEGFKKEYKREPGYLEMALIRSDKKQDYIEKELNFIKDEGGLSLVQSKEYVKIFNLINEVTPDDLSKIKEGQTADQIIKSLKKEYKERISEVQTETEGDGREVFQPIETKEKAEGVFQPIETKEETEGVFQPIETEEENSEVFQPIK
jgi:ribosomal protein S18 acetylase RimI-like enzyme